MSPTSPNAFSIRDAAQQGATPARTGSRPAVRDGDSPSAQILRRLPIEDYLARLGVTVPHSGKILCPLPDHDDTKTASCHVYGGDRGWHCYGCGRGGTVIDLVMHLDGIDAGGAIRKLASDLGIELVAPVTTLSEPFPSPNAPPHELPHGGGMPKGQPPAPALEFVTFADLAARVDARGPRRWLLRGLWPAGDYGVHAAEQKAQKTWNTCDLAVSVASGTPWLGIVEVDQPGPVVMFAGEGGEANIVRRIRAIAEARNVAAETLPIVVCTRAPHLNRAEHLAAMRDQLEATRPALVTLDPLYLSARSADKGDLYGMGELLEGPQHIYQAAGASLFVVTHFNRQQGAGARRITGAGPAEWGRVIITSSVISKHTDPQTRATTVLTELDAIGGEIPDQALRVRRRIWSDDPDDLDAPLHVETAVEDAHAAGDGPAGATDLPPAAQKLLAALDALAPAPKSGSELVDWIVSEHGHGLKRETVSRTLNDLERRGLVDSIVQEAFKPKLWLRASSAPAEEVPDDPPQPL